MSERTIGALLASAVATAPDDPFLLYGDQALTFSEVDRRAGAAAAALSACGVARGDRVASLVGNDPAFVVNWFAAAKLGACLVPLDPRSTAHEAASALRGCDPSLVVAQATFMPSAREACAQAGLQLPLASEEITSGGDASNPPAEVREEDVAVMFPTSGTTGRSKLVMQSHRSLVMAGESFPWWVGLTREDRLLTALPVFHLNAMAYSILGALSLCAPLVLLPRFSASRFMGEARAYGATEFNAVGAMLEILSRQPARGEDASNTFRLCYAAPAPATEERHTSFERRFGIEILAGYALSESPFGTVWPRSGPRPYGSIGHLRQHPTLGKVNEARVVDESGKDVADGESGELLLRNPAVMSGYFRSPEATERALRDGWLHTGDVVMRNSDGIYTFVARRKEIIRRRGENIAPGEVEEALLAHPGIAEAAVVGVPADLGEEDVKAFVVLAGSEPLDVEELARALSATLSRFKLPRYVEITDELPRTATGRVAKHRLPRERGPGEVELP